MKISFNTSSFSFQFIAGTLFVVSILVALFLSKNAGLVILALAAIIFLQKKRFLIPHSTHKVIAQIEKTFSALSIPFERKEGAFLTKTTHIHVAKFGPFTEVHFVFEKVYNKQGKYLVETIVKYLRYIRN